MFNLKPLACLVTEPPGVSCWCLLVSGSCPPARCSPVCRSEQRGVVAADQFLHRAAVTSQLCRDPRPVQTCTPWPAWRYSTVTSDHVRTQQWHHAVPRPPLLGAGRAAAAGHRPLDPGGLAPASGLGVLLVRHPVSRSVSSTHSWIPWKLWRTSDTLTIDNWHQMDTCN